MNQYEAVKTLILAQQVMSVFFGRKLTMKQSACAYFWAITEFFHREKDECWEKFNLKIFIETNKGQIRPVRSFDEARSNSMARPYALFTPHNDAILAAEKFHNIPCKDLNSIFKVTDKSIPGFWAIYPITETFFQKYKNSCLEDTQIIIPDNMVVDIKKNKEIFLMQWLKKLFKNI